MEKIMTKEMQVSYNNGKLTIKDSARKDAPVIIPDARGYIPNPSHKIFKIEEPSENGVSTIYSIEDITQTEDSQNRLQMLAILSPDGNIDVKGPKDFGHKTKKHNCGLKAAQADKRCKHYARMSMEKAHY